MNLLKYNLQLEIIGSRHPNLYHSSSRSRSRRQVVSGQCLLCVCVCAGAGRSAHCTTSGDRHSSEWTLGSDSRFGLSIYLGQLLCRRRTENRHSEQSSFFLLLLLFLAEQPRSLVMYPMRADLTPSSLAFVLLFATTILHELVLKSCRTIFLCSCVDCVASASCRSTRCLCSSLVDTVEAKGHINFGYDGAHALLHAPNSSEQAYMSGGPLKGIYAFEQLHFHWGENDLEGSEDLINNHSFAMELHAVFYKDQYGSINEAVKYPDGLAVLAFFFEAEASDRLNPTFHPIVAALPKIEKVGSEIQLHQSMRLEHLLNPAGPLSDRMQNYFTYNGSLTTPPCSEVVVWIDFKHPLYLSHSQLESFRSISSSEGQKLTHNFRPVQPLSDRLVLHNLPGGPWNSRFDQPYWSAAGPTTTATTSFALLFLAIIVLLMSH
ncbi:unnamed protein product [Trichogramma brassicae]|uniref:Alpha-carbonic anhydrase domain-containing protein n=1 Tax=Trichogramma brassicae TaxID=86971 RepID=A0A6H5I6X7_9HYME|nr:unnamed protein product [Trichogramma brassicae]